jgi:hypothetical protein
MYLENMFTAHLGVTIQFGAGVRDRLFYFPSSPGGIWRSASQSSGYAGSLPGLRLKECEVDDSTSFRAEVLYLVQDQLHLYVCLGMTTGTVWSFSISRHRSKLTTRFSNLNTEM